MNLPFPITILIAAIFLVISAFDKPDSSEPQLIEAVEMIEEAAVDSIPGASPDSILNLQSDSTEALALIQQPAEPPLETQGFRVQVLSTTDEVKALELADRLKSELLTNVSIAFAGGEWKVRTGDFLIRENARLLCDELKAGEFPDAWIVECAINPSIPGFRVQMTSVSTENQAAAFARLVGADSKFPVYIIKKDDTWKVRLGDFKNHSEAEAVRAKMTAKGYLDMWIVEDQVNRK
ncbi:SPOR domain-containing protein [bacterium]|nr:SPOR domain-containing protein [FCB group bacterium]MBL7191379.1 SPOR domain-containing protein [bacterium]